MVKTVCACYRRRYVSARKVSRARMNCKELLGPGSGGLEGAGVPDEDDSRVVSGSAGLCSPSVRLALKYSVT